MIRLRHQLVLPVLALALSACVEPPKQAPVTDPPIKAPEPKPAAATQKPERRKPVGMNDRGEVSSISLEDFFMLQQAGNAMIFDARPSFFFGLGHIPGAINLPKNNCDEGIAAREGEIKSALAAGKTIVVYCTGLTCPDARTVARHLASFGYPAKIFTAGWDAWKEAGMPTE